MSTDRPRSLVERLEDRVLLSTVLYRVDAGGSGVGGTPAWSPDTNAAPSPHTNAPAAGSKSYTTTAAIDLTHPSVPTGTPASVFQSERTDFGGTPMQWDFAVAAGEYEVRLYFAEIYAGSFAPGARLIDVRVEGQLVLDNYDVFADAGGGDKAVVKSFTVANADGNLDVDFVKVRDNPFVNAIEIVRLDAAPPPNQPPLVSAGADQTITLPDTAALAGSASDDGLPVGGTLTPAWTQVSGPGTATFADPSAAATTASFSAPGTYVLRLTAGDGEFTRSDDMTVTVNPQNTAPVLSAGPDVSVTLPESASLAGTSSDDGLPAGGSLANLWSVVSGPGTVTFEDGTSPATTASFSAAGTYVLRLTATDGALSSSDDVTVTVTPAEPQNQPPAVSAGADQTLGAATADLAGSASDDGLPTGSTLTTTWAKVSGPGSVTFADASSPATAASFSLAGTYVLRLTATDGALSASDDVTVTVEPSPQPGPAGVVYRVNAGGPGADDTPAWAGDTNPVPSPYTNAVAAGSKTYKTTAAIDLTHPSVPAGTPMALFQDERWDGGGIPMEWDFAVAAGQYEVRLYFAEIYPGSFVVGSRQFDVALEGQLVLDDYDVFADVGANKGLVKTYTVTNTDGNLDIDFGRVKRDPNVKAIEIVRLETGPAPLGASVTSLDFGPKVAGQTATRTLTLTNLGAAGDADIVIDATMITGADANVFSDDFDDAGNVTLSPGQSHTFTVTFAPTTEGARAATLEIAHNGRGGPLAIPLAGTGTPAGSENLAPVVGAGADATITLPSAATLSGSAADDGLPAGGSLVTTWTQVSGTGTASFADPAAPDTTATFSAPGTYVLRLTATDGVLSSSDDVTLTVRAAATPVSFGKSAVAGTASSKPTSLQFGPDGRLYVGQQNGTIRIYTIARGGVNQYAVNATETINLINAIPNHNDDGALNPAVNTRLITGILVTGTAANPVVYVASSDPRIGGGSDGEDLNLDTNSGIISRLTWSGSSWVKLDLVRGLPRSEENHANNGMQLDGATNTLYVAMGGNTNMGAPSNNFARLPEYALSAAILSIDLAAIGNTTYDLPTLDDEDRPGTDANDPFGGNNGKNQARLVSGGPVQVYAPGFRNPYDLVITKRGQMYTIDNGGNAGWGSVPLDPSGQPTTPATAGTATNALSEPGVSHDDQLHLVTGRGYYGGHPNPTRANRGNTFNPTNPQSPVEVANPAEGAYLTPGVADGALALFPDSTNGITEYTASNFGGEMTGDLLTVGHDNKLYRVKLSPDGTMAVFNQVLFGAVGAVPLDVVARGDGESFAGSIWVADYWTGNIVVFEPETAAGTGADDPDLDEDGDGFDNADEIDNGTNPLSPGDAPADWDGDFHSDLNDPDDDNDALPDDADPFALDPLNGSGTSLPVRYGWENDAVPSPGGILNLGFTGLMTDGTTNYRDLFDRSKMTAGGAAGVLTVDEVADGDALGASNAQQYALQFGVNVTTASGPFQVRTRVLAPFSGLTPEAGQSIGLFFGTGDQNNYVKLVVTGDNGGSVTAVAEIGGVAVVIGTAALPLAGVDSVDLYLAIDPGTGAIQASFAATAGGATGPVTRVGDAQSIPLAWLAAATAPAVGIISTSAGPAPTFAATWDFIEVTPVEPSRLSVTETSVNFGPVTPGSVATRTLTLRNMGGAGDPDIVIDATTIVGGAGFSDAFDDASNVTLRPGESIDLLVTFAPDAVGIRDAELHVAHSGTASPLVVSLRGGVTNGLLGEYFDGVALDQPKGARVDPTVNFVNADWGDAPPGTGVAPDDVYSERWTGFVKIDTAGAWTFSTNSNDGVRLWVNGVQLVNNWTRHSTTQNNGTINLQPGWYPIRLEHFQDGTDVVIQLSFAGPSQLKTIVPTSHLATGTDPLAPYANKLGVALSGPLDFGAVSPNRATTRTITLTNLGPAGAPDIVIDATTITGPDAAIFADAFDDAGSITLAPGQSYSLAVTILPTTIGAKAATLEIAHTGDGGPTLIELNGDAGDAWITGTPMPVSLEEPGAAVVGTKIYIAGHGSNGIRAYDTVTKTWSGNLGDRPHPGKDQVAQAIDGKIYLVGGVATIDGVKQAMNKLQIFDLATKTWTTGADLPFTTFAAATAVVGGKLYVAGGVTGIGSPLTTTDQAAVYDPATNAWTMIAPMLQPRNSGAAGTDGQRLYVFGGRVGGDAPSNGFDTVQIYDPATNAWISSLDPAGPGAALAELPQPRGGIMTAPFVNGEFYVIGGETKDGPGATPDKVYDRVDIYSVATNTWRQGPPMPTARHGIAPVAFGGDIYVIGGGTKSGASKSNLMEILDLL